MNFLKTTALGLVLCLGLLTHTLSVTAATGDDSLLEATARRLSQQQLWQLQTRMGSAHLVSTAEQLNFVGMFLRGRGMVSSDVQENLSRFVSCQRLLMSDQEGLKSRLAGTFKVLGIKGSPDVIEEVMGMMERQGHYADQTMGWMTTLATNELIDSETLFLFRKFLGAEVMLADTSNPQQSFSNALAFLGVELEAPSHRMTAEDFAGISLTMRTTYVRSSLLDLTAHFLTLLETKGIIKVGEKKTFDALLSCQRYISKSISQSLVALGVDSSTLEARFVENPNRLLPLLKDKGWVSVGKATNISTFWKTKSFELADAHAVINRLQLPNVSRMRLFLEMLNPSAEGPFENLAQEMQANSSQPLLVKTNLLLTALIAQNILKETDAVAFKKLFAMQQALNKSTGHEGLKQAITALGIVVDAPTPKKEATPSVLDQLRAQSAGYSSFSSQTSERSQSASRTTGGEGARAPRTPLSASLQPSEKLQQWAQDFLRDLPVDDITEEKSPSVRSFTSVRDDLEAAAVQLEEGSKSPTPRLQSPEPERVGGGKEDLTGKREDVAIEGDQSALSLMADLPAPLPQEERREDDHHGALALMPVVGGQPVPLAVSSAPQREQVASSLTLALGAPLPQEERREDDHHGALALMPVVGGQPVPLALSSASQREQVASSLTLALPGGLGGNIPSEK